MRRLAACLLVFGAVACGPGRRPAAAVWTDRTLPARFVASQLSTTAASGEVWIAGGSRLLHSTDAGASFESVTLPATPTGMAFRDGSTGWISTGGRLLGTRDAGRTWREVTLPPAVSAEGVDYMDSELWVIGSAARSGAGPTALAVAVLLVSADRGAHWRRALELRPGGPYQGPQAYIRYVSAAGSTVFVDGFGREGNGPYSSHDGGLTFHLLGSADGVYHDVDAASGTIAYRPVAVPDAHGAYDMRRSRLLQSRDGGATWNAVTAVGDAFWAIAFAAGGRGLVVQGREVKVTRDGGTTWVTVGRIAVDPMLRYAQTSTIAGPQAPPSPDQLVGAALSGADMGMVLTGRHLLAGPIPPLR